MADVRAVLSFRDARPRRVMQPPGSAMRRSASGPDLRRRGRARVCGVRLCGVRACGALLLLVLAAACKPAVEQAVPAPGDDLEHALLAGDVYQRRRAVDELAQRGAAALPVLAKALDEPSPDVRAAATQALVRMGPTALPLLGRAAADRKTVVRDPATRALVAMGTPAVPAFQEALASPDHYVRENAASALGALGPEAIPALRQATTDQDRRVKRAAIEALGQVGPDAIPTLRGLDLGGDSGLEADVERILERLQGGGGDSTV